LSSVVSPEQEKLFHNEQAFLERLAFILKELGAAPEDVHTLQVASEQLRDLFLLVIVGEFNSGKSSFLNAMLGSKFLAEVRSFLQRESLPGGGYRLCLTSNAGSDSNNCSS